MGRRVASIVAIVSLMLVLAPGSEAKKKHKPPIPITSCNFPADKAGRTYRLTSPLPTCNDVDGIVVLAPNVTIDLGDNDLVGNSTAGNDGIDNTGGHANVRVRNGGIFQFDYGIKASGSTKMAVRDMKVSQNVADGIWLGTSSVIKFVTASENGGAGFVIGASSFLSFVTASGNTTDGITGSGDKIRVKFATAAGNYANGIRVAGDFVSISKSDATGNVDDGVAVSGDDAKVGSVRSSGNDTGIRTVGDRAHISGSNTAANDADGVRMSGDNNSLRNTSASGNDVNGIHIGGPFAALRGVNASGNGFSGPPDDIGLGILVDLFGTHPPTGTDLNVFGNDNPDECDPASLCD